MTKKTIKVRYEGGKLIPLEPVEMNEGETALMTYESTTDEMSPEELKRAEVIRRSYGALKGVIDPDEWKKRVYEAREAGTRPDADP
ncbi:MAG: antitoxin family protein [Candidatus Poribacteria bacterium]|nr:antitoxin family protein [Candidatus Poribacteria bacterium]